MTEQEQTPDPSSVGSAGPANEENFFEWEALIMWVPTQYLHGNGTSPFIQNTQIFLTF